MDLSKKEALLFPRLVFGGLGLRDASSGLDVSRRGLDDDLKRQKVCHDDPKRFEEAWRRQQKS